MAMVLRAVLLLCMVARRRVRCLGHVRPVVSPSVAKADMLHLGSELASCVEAGCAWLHFSIQDGIFVPKTSFGAPVVAAARRGVPDDVVLDVKLSCVEPENRVDEFAKAGADAISFHPEATKQPVAVLQRIRDAGVGRPASSAPRPLRRAPDGLPSPPAPAQVSPGVVLNPGTAVATVEELVDLADLAVVMLVSPGWGGPKYVDAALSKVRALRAKRPDLHISVDGGVDAENAGAFLDAGANVLVAGGAMFKAHDKAAAVAGLLRSGTKQAA